MSKTVYKKCRFCGRLFEATDPKQTICCILCEEKERKKKKEKQKKEAIEQNNERVIETIKECKHKDCKYRGMFSGLPEGSCDYMLIEDEPRGCKISECNKYKPGKKTKMCIVYKNNK